MLLAPSVPRWNASCGAAAVDLVNSWAPCEVAYTTRHRLSPTMTLIVMHMDTMVVSTRIEAKRRSLVQSLSHLVGSLVAKE